MAGRRDSARDTIFAIVLLLLMFVAPFIIGVGWIVTEVRAWLLQPMRAGAEASLIATIERASSAVEELRQAGFDEGLDIRKDGMFDGRSRSGRVRNAQIVAEAEAAASAQEELHDLLSPLIQRDAMRAAVAAWVVTFLATLSMDIYRLAVASTVAIGVGALSYKISGDRRLGVGRA